MKKILLSIAVCFTCAVFAQQGPLYSQYMLIEYGFNPAVGGYTDGWQVMSGRRTQWRGFDYAPVSNFLGIHRSIGKKYYRNNWHGAGLYVEDDNEGLTGQRMMYLSYSYHQRIAKRYTVSFGLFAGARIHSISAALYDPNDPALSTYPAILLMGPEIVPGIHLRSKNMFADVCMRNIYKSKIEGQGKVIGTPSRLKPHLYFSLGRKFISSSYYYSLVPSVQLRYTQAAFPSIDLNCMMYIKQRIGLGISYRANDAAIAMLHVRVTKTIIIGFAYDYVTSRIRNRASASQEVMFGFSPIGAGDMEPARNVAECPRMEF
jgi:type IX secretion system PorP/SprF family membrane protein